MTTTATERLELVERHLAAIQLEVSRVRRDLAGESVEAAPTAAPSAAAPAFSAETMVAASGRRAPEAPPPARAPVAAAAVPAPPPPPRREIDLLSPGALAWAGGIAVLAGVVFLFVMAVTRGLIGPELRVGFGGLLSAALVTCGSMLRSRIGSAAASVVSTGAGLASAFVTIVAASRIYGFVDPLVALGLGVVVAAGAAWLAVSWDEETVAGFGLVGAMLTAPIIESAITPTGTWFVLIALAAALAAAIDRGWWKVGALASAVGVGQVLLLIGDRRLGSFDSFTQLPQTVGAPSVIAVAAAAWALLAGAAVAAHLRSGGEGLARPTLVGLGAALTTAIVAILSLFAQGVPGADPQGVAFVVGALAYAALGGGLWWARGRGDLPLVLGATCLALLAAGIGELASGSGRIAAFAAQGALLAWIALRAGDHRLRYAAGAELGLATVFALHALSPDAFFSPGPIGAQALIGAWFVALAAAVAAWTCLAEGWGARAAVGAGAAALYALSFTILGVLQAGTGLDSLDADGAFQRAHTAVSVAWVVLGLGLLVVGLRRRETSLRLAGLGLLAMSAAKLVLFDLANLDAMARALSFLIVGGVLIAAAAVYARQRPEVEEGAAASARAGREA